MRVAQVMAGAVLGGAETFYERLCIALHTAGEEVLHFERPGGWHCVTNFGAEPVELPDGELLVASAPLVDGRLGADATAWIRVTD